MKNREILDSWKEIAAYLGRSEKTCRRLERELGLPIHRFEESPKARVYAYKDEIASWIQETQHSEKRPFTQKKITAAIGFKKLLVPVLVIVILGIIAVIIWQPWTNLVQKAISSDKPSLAILYFENNTGDESLDYWRKALTELLIADILQSKYIEVLSGDRLFNLLRQLNLSDVQSYSSEDLQKIAARGGVNHILLGSYMKAGQLFRINIMIQNVRISEEMSSEVVEGEGEKSFFSMVDELTKRIKTRFEFSEAEIASDIDRDVGKITTGSPEAFRHYVEGQQIFQTGDFRKSIQGFEDAVKIDPEFAMAYRKMSNIYFNLRNFTEAKRYALRALELSDRLSKREHYIIQGWFYFMSEKTWDKAIDAYRNLLEIYPEDAYGNTSIGFIYLLLEEWDEAIARYNVNYESSLRTKVENPFSAGNLSNCYRGKGLYDKATEVLENYLAKVSENPIVLYYLTECYLCQGKYDFALVTAEKTVSLMPDSQDLICDVCQLMGDLEHAVEACKRLFESGDLTSDSFAIEKLQALYLLQGKLEKAKEQAEKGVELNQERGEMMLTGFFYSILAYIQLASGNYEEALKELEKGWKYLQESESLAKQRYNLFMKGIAYVSLNSIEYAQIIADELKKSIENGLHRKHWRYYYHLLGLIEYKKGNLSDAIAYFEKALTFLSSQIVIYYLFDEHALFMGPLAKAYYQAGDIEKALTEYKKITNLTTGRFYFGDIYTKAFYMLGKIYEQQGNSTEAIEHYEKFLELWKDADLGIDEVEDAGKRLAVLITRGWS